MVVGAGKTLTKQINYSKYTALIIIVVIVVLMSILNKNFFRPQTFINIMGQIPAIGIVSIAALFILISGGIDLSAGYALALSGVMGGTFYLAFNNALVALVLGSIATGTLIGLVNGTVIARLKIQPFIFTLAMLSICQGLTLFVWEGNTLILKEPAVLFIGQGMVFGVIPFSFILFLAVCLMAWVVLNRTKIGTYTYALGSSESAAGLAGIPVAKYKTLVYVLAGSCIGLSSVITVTTIATITNNLHGSVVLDAVASTVIGGTSISGGKGTVFGTFMGVILVSLISTIMTFLQVDSLLRDSVKGAIILFALFLDVMINHKMKLPPIQP